MDTTEQEERIAHLTRTCDDLSDEVAAQAARIARLERQVALLMDRERDREGGVSFGDDRPPPHY